MTDESDGYRVFCSKCSTLEENVSSGEAAYAATFHDVPDHHVYWFPESSDGALISIEGIDGSGKTTLWNSLRDEFGDDDRFVFTREPRDDTWYGEAVYRSLNDDDADPVSELFLYMADHAYNLSDTILPALSDGKIVVTDRYIDSRCAYQAASIESLYGNEEDTIQFIYDLHQSMSVFPDLTLYTSVSPSVSVERSEQANKFEELSFLESVGSNYKWLSLTDPERFVSLDTEEFDSDTVSSHAAAIIRRSITDL